MKLRVIDDGRDHAKERWIQGRDGYDTMAIAKDAISDHRN
jgi:hypothetical protein